MNAPRPDVAAVVVTFHPDGRLERVLEAALGQVARVVVVDNGSPPEALAVVETAAGRHAGRLTLIRNDANRGIAAAQNQGLDRAMADGASWLLLLDQDSVPRPGMVDALLAAAGDGARGSVGIAAAVPWEEGQRRPTRFVVSPDGCRVGKAVAEAPVLHDLLYAIASGSLFAAAVFRTVGPMREDFFIDGVDFEFALRVRRTGYRLVAVRDARLDHRLGAYEERRVLGAGVAVTHHGAARRFTQARNRVRLMRLHGRAVPAVLRVELPGIVKDLARVLLFEQAKGAKALAMVRGILAGLRD